jgi:hypothetical protein
MLYEIGPGLAAAGYRHPAYAHSLMEFGTLRRLPRSGGWIIERETLDACARDAMGCYPLLACADWTGLRSDLDDLTASLVSVSAVTVPFGIEDSALLRRCFPDFVVPLQAPFHRRPDRAPGAGWRMTRPRGGEHAASETLNDTVNASTLKKRREM